MQRPPVPGTVPCRCPTEAAERGHHSRVRPGGGTSEVAGVGRHPRESCELCPPDAPPPEVFALTPHYHEYQGTGRGRVVKGARNQPRMNTDRTRRKTRLLRPLCSLVCLLIRVRS